MAAAVVMNRYRFIPYVLIILAALAAYSNSFHGPFVFDDYSSIVDNPSIHQLWPLSRVLIPVESATVTGRPVLNLSLAINYAISGTNVLGYHVTNLAIHLIAAMVLYSLIRRTLRLPDAVEYLHRRSDALALIIAILWCVHPLHTGAVTVVIQRAESLMGMFYLITLYAALRASSSTRPLLWLGISAVCCWLGVATKEVIVSAPLVVLLYDRIFITGSFKTSLRQKGGYYFAMAMSWVLFAWLTLSLGSERMVGFNLGIGSMDYALTQFGVITHYLVLSFWPHPLILDYGNDVAEYAIDIVPYAIFIMALLAGSVYLLIRKPRLGFVCIMFFVLLAPSSSILPIPTQTAAEHRMYLALACVIIITVLACVNLLKKVAPANGQIFKYATVAAVVVAAAALGLRTYVRNSDYRSVTRIWESNIRYRPQYYRPYNNLAVELNTQQRFDEALRYLDTALELEPEAALAMHSRGVALTGLKRYPEAVACFTRAIELGMVQPRVYELRGSVRAKLQQYEAAIDDFTQVLSMQPENAMMFYYRGLAFARSGNTDKALHDFSQSLRLEPDHIDARHERGMLYGQLQQYQKSIDDFSEVIRLKPDYGLAYENRAICWFVLNKLDLARKDIEMAQKLGRTIQPRLLQLLESEERYGASD